MAVSIRSLIALGANVGHASDTLDQAILDLRASGPEIVLLDVSPYFVTSPVGGPGGQPAYVNAVASIESSLSPERLLERLRMTEARFGRTSAPTWAARTLDMDILSYGDQCLHSKDLTIPHPRMTVRRFVLDPLREIAPDWVHPQLGWSVTRILSHLATGERMVALGDLHRTLAEPLGELRSSSDELQDWRFVRAAERPLFEVFSIAAFSASDRWTAPRFYSTSTQVREMAEQIVATCLGLSDEP